MSDDEVEAAGPVGCCALAFRLDVMAWAEDRFGTEASMATVEHTEGGVAYIWIDEGEPTLIARASGDEIARFEDEYTDGYVELGRIADRAAGGSSEIVLARVRSYQRFTRTPDGIATYEELYVPHDIVSTAERWPNFEAAMRDMKVEFDFAG